MADPKDYEAKYKAKLDQLKADIERYEAKWREAEADAKAGYREMIDELRRRRDEAEKEWRRLRDAGQSASAEMLKGFDSAYNDLKNAFDKALDRFGR